MEKMTDGSNRDVCTTGDVSRLGLTAGKRALYFFFFDGMSEDQGAIADNDIARLRLCQDVMYFLTKTHLAATRRVAAIRKRRSRTQLRITCRLTCMSRV